MTAEKLPARQLLLIHGWGMNKSIWTHIEQQLVEQLSIGQQPGEEISILSVDLPGYGKSKSLTEPYTLTHLAQQLAAHLDRAEQTIVLGWSLGGLIAIELAKLYPEKINQLVLLASNPKFVQAKDWKFAVERQVFINFANDLKKDIKKTIKRFIAIQAMGSTSAREDIKQIAGLIEQQGYADYDTLNKGLDLLLSSDQRSTLLDLTLPVLLIAGNRDQLVNIKAMDYIAGQGEHISLQIIKGAGHAPFISHSELFLSILKNNLSLSY